MAHQIHLLLSVAAVAAVIPVVHHLTALFRSCRSSIPWAHWSCGVSSLWILSKRYHATESQTIHDAHQAHGPVVRLSPREVSVNCVKGGIQTIYAGGFDKHEWYSNLFDNFDLPNMFSITESRPHSARKRMISNIYSKSYLQNSDTLKAMTRVLFLERLLPRLDSLSKSSQSFDVLPLICASTMDFVTSYLFGLSSSAGFLLDEKQRDEFLANYTSRHAYNFYPQEVPLWTNLLKRLGWRLVPTWVDAANASIQALTLRMCDGAAERLKTLKDASPTDVPEVYRQLKSAMDKSYDKETFVSNDLQPSQRLDIASEMLDHFAAGFDTSAITVVFLVHELSQRQDIQDALRHELRSLEHPIRLPSPTSSDPSEQQQQLASAKTLESLPLLHATVQETLRLRAAIPGPQPRITPAAGCLIGPPGAEHFVRGGTRISAQAHSLHRNAHVFAEPERWRPERWLLAGESGSSGSGIEGGSSAEQLREMQRWFWAFGSGGRMCVGSNLALYQIKYIVAAIYTSWRTVVVDDTGFYQRDMYTAPPASGRLDIRLEPVAW